MELGYLAEFEKLAHTLNFTEAADELHLSQSTLSKHIAALESNLGVKLFDRQSNRISLTEEGFYLLSVAGEVQRILQEAEVTFSLMRQRKPYIIDARLDDHVISKLILSAIEQCQQEELPPVQFNHIADKNPLELLVKGEIDLCIDMPPYGEYQSDNIVCNPIMTRPMGVVVNKTNALASNSKVSFEDLRRSTFLQVIWNRFTAGWAQIEVACQEHGYVPKYRSCQVRSFTEALSIPLKDAVLVVPYDSSEASAISNAGKVLLPICDKDAVFTTCVLYLRDNFQKVEPFLLALNKALESVTEREVIGSASGK